MDVDIITPESGWSEERIQLLKKLWLEGKSGSEIALILGNGITRNAVLSKIHYLKLSHTDKPRLNHHTGPSKAARLQKSGKIPQKPREVADTETVNMLVQDFTRKSSENPNRPPRGFQETRRYGLNDIGVGNERPPRSVTPTPSTTEKVPHEQWCHYRHPVTDERCQKARIILDGREQAYCETHINHQPSSIAGTSSLYNVGNISGGKLTPRLS